jgi:hypothetical protein
LDDEDHLSIVKRRRAQGQFVNIMMDGTAALTPVASGKADERYSGGAIAFEKPAQTLQLPPTPKEDTATGRELPDASTQVGDAASQIEGELDNDQSEELIPEDDYDTNSNWDFHEQVQERLDEYKQLRRQVKGHEKWTEAQSKLHKMLWLRGSWPMLEMDWTFNFRMRNIYPWVYAPEGSQKRVAITYKSNEFRGKCA